MQTASRSCLESRDGWRVSSSSATRSLVTMTLSCEAVPGEDRATGGCCVQVPRGGLLVQSQALVVISSLRGFITAGRRAPGARYSFQPCGRGPSAGCLWRAVTRSPASSRSLISEAAPGRGRSPMACPGSEWDPPTPVACYATPNDAWSEQSRWWVDESGHSEEGLRECSVLFGRGE